MSEEIAVQIPRKLAEFIDELTKQGYFESRADFARCSLEMIGELYGLSKTAKDGKSLLDILVDKGKVDASKPKTVATTAPQKQIPTIPKQPQPSSSDSLTNEEYDILDMFTGSTFEFEDALHARFTMELMKQAKAPMPKEEFVKKLEHLAVKKKIARTEHKRKAVWKLIDKY